MNNRSILKNSIFNALYKGFTALFPLISTAYVSRVLLASGVGRVAYAHTIVNYFTIIAALGIPNYGVKAIAQSQDEKEKTITFLELFFLNLFSTLICIGVYFFFINFNTHFSSDIRLYNTMGLLLVLNIFNIDWFYQGIEKYDYIAVRSIIVKLVSFFLILILVKNERDYITYGFILCLATAGNYILNTINAVKYLQLAVYKLSLRKHLKPVIILLASAVATEIYTMLDTVMLEYFYDASYVGYYSNTVKIVRMVYTVSISIVATFYPRVSYYIKEKKIKECNALITKGFKIIMIIALPCTVGLFLTADMLIPILFGASFTPAIITLKVISILICIFSTAYFLGHIVLMSAAREKDILFATICGAFVNAFANYVLIPIYQHNGAAIASVFAEIMVTMILLFKAKQYYKLSVNLKDVISVSGSLTILIVSVLLVRMIPMKTVLSLVLSVSIGGLSYFFTLMILKNETFLSLVNLIKKRL